MITNLKPYPAYKDSGVPWLGEVPAHWEVVPLCGLGRPKKVTNCVDRELLSVYLHRGVIRFSDVPVKRTNPTSEDLSKYQAVDYGDFVLNNQQAWRGSVGVSKYSGIVSPAYLVFALNGRLDTTYADRLLQDRSMVDQYLICSKGVGSIQRNLYWLHLRRVAVPLPPLPEQTAIVRFLDWAEQRIRRVIRARQRQIKLLEEYKQALIHQAVTGQIDVRTGQPYPGYKPSGVEWLGQVPEHWVVRRLKRIARLNPSKSEVPLAMRNDPAVFLPMERVGSDVRFYASEVRPISALWNGFTYFRRGDVIVAKITPCFENGKGACLENLPTAFGFGSTEFHVIRPSNAIVSAYLYRVTTLSEFRRLGADEMTGAAGQQRVPVEFIANFPIPLPPLPEQNAIVEYLDTQTTKIDTAIAATRREIELLREYRTRLIADVVTGKVDVREVAARLPEEPPEEEAESMDADEIAEDETTDEEAGTETVEEEEVEQ